MRQALTTAPPLILFWQLSENDGKLLYTLWTTCEFFFSQIIEKLLVVDKKKSPIFFSIKLRLTDGDVISFDAQVPFKHDSLLVDKKELKLTKAEKREAKRGKRPILISF